jgi:hypothetical protein
MRIKILGRAIVRKKLYEQVILLAEAQAIYGTMAQERNNCFNQNLFI